MSDSLPRWLIEALGENPRPNPRAALDEAVYPGDIRVAHAMGGEPLRRHVLVLDSDEATGLIHVCLLSNQTSLANDFDVLLPPSATGVAYDLIVETQLHAKILSQQVSEAIGSIDDDLLDNILDFIWDERPDELEERRGLPSATKTAARVEFEKEELSDFQRLTWPDAAPGTPQEHFVDRSVLPRLAETPPDMEVMSATLSLWDDLRQGTIHCCDVGFPFFDKGPGEVDASVYSALLHTFACDLLADNSGLRTVYPNSPAGPMQMLVGDVTHSTRSPAPVVVIYTVMGSLNGCLLGSMEDGTAVIAEDVTAHRRSSAEQTVDCA